MLNTTPFGTIVQNAVFGNDSLISAKWNLQILGCSAWKLPNHPLFQVANAALFLGLLSPHTKHGIMFLHSIFVFGFLCMSIWAWVILCSPDYFSWNFAFMMINIIQMFVLFYSVKPIKFDQNLEKLYQTVFQPMNVSRRLFKKLTDKNLCIVSNLFEGDAYAVQGITKTDRLALLITGVMKVYSQQNLLHYIHETEFIDSPEFESSVTGDEKFQVSIYANSNCQLIYWPRPSLEYILVKEPFLAIVFSTIMGRDIIDKLYALDSQVRKPELIVNKMDHYDTSTMTSDLRRTLAQLGIVSKLKVDHHTYMTNTLNNLGTHNEIEDIEVLMLSGTLFQLMGPCWYANAHCLYDLVFAVAMLRMFRSDDKHSGPADPYSSKEEEAELFVECYVH